MTSMDFLNSEAPFYVKQTSKTRWCVRDDDRVIIAGYDKEVHAKQACIEFNKAWKDGYLMAQYHIRQAIGFWQDPLTRQRA